MNLEDICRQLLLQPGYLVNPAFDPSINISGADPEV